MKKKTYSVFITAATWLFGSLLFTGQAFADTGYWDEAGETIWRNSAGECWRTSGWNKENASIECGDVEDADGDGIPDDKDNCADTPEGVQISESGCEVDSDGDGVADSKDNCADTPAGASVNEQGCESDSDGDGIVDSQDSCANTAKGTQVNEQGCALDSDGDGIADASDSCAETPAGVKVDNKGCELQEVTSLEGVTFGNNSDALEAVASAATLDVVVETLNRYPDMRIELAGYTDSSGPASYNQKLSEQRATAVRDYIANQGIDGNRLTVKGYGEENPVADNTTVEGRATNRRVEMHILK